MPFEKKTELRSPEILKRIFELRNQGSGFNNIAKAISDEFEVSLTHPTAKNLYYEYAAKQKIKTETPGENPTSEWDNLLKVKFERIEKITNSLLDAVEAIKKKLSVEMYLKYAPTIIAILKESLSQLSFIRNEQQQIIVKQQNLVYSPLQIMNQINQIDDSKNKNKELVIIPNIPITDEELELEDELDGEEDGE